MSESKHTPGPWSYTIHLDIAPNNCMGTIAFGEGAIANVSTWRGGVPGTNVETKANTALIAAAPELLEACEETLKSIAESAFALGAESLTIPELIGRWDALSEEIRAAIAKAKGETDAETSNGR